ncbi:cytochrome P450 2G1-like isoform X1 [Rhinatrema bivittatum]|uniref:cytochrome P450 2G1-like isoform X1 n=1 Tax=Rhinatrema bivittatum TaxID=194408 RepID=UPI00112E971A|nr:cytochrome P450 2G1-like isoform X1 [Rhinatrema bivittatum]
MVLGDSVFLLLIFSISFLIFFSAWRSIKKWKKMPPGPTPLPFVGNILQVKPTDMLNSFRKLHKTYGPAYVIYLGTLPVLILNGYDAVKEALIDNADVFGARGSSPGFKMFFTEYGIVSSNGERWKQLRRFALMTLRNFGMGKRSIEERIQEEAKFLVEEFKKTKGSPFDPTFYFSRSSSNIICSVIFGNRFDYQEEKFVALLKLLNQFSKLFDSPFTQIFNIFPHIMQYVPGPHLRVMENMTRLKEFIIEKKKMNEESLDPNCPRDFIDCFLIKREMEKQNPASEFNDDNLVMSTLNLFFAGSETTSATLRYAFLILLKYPEITENVVREIDLVIGQERAPAVEDRSKMPYTDAVIHEVQRFADIAPLGAPHEVTQDIEFRGYTIPKGTMVFPALTTVLKDPKWFKNPYSFDPGHFLDENGAFKKNDAFMPFSAGKRICLGEGLARMELFLIITTILQNLTLTTTKEPKDIDLSSAPIGQALADLEVGYRIFSDDIQFFVHVSRTKDKALQKVYFCLKCLNQWLTKNKLVLNMSKTEILYLVRYPTWDFLRNLDIDETSINIYINKNVK